MTAQSFCKWINYVTEFSHLLARENNPFEEMK